MRAPINATRKRIHVHTNALQPKKRAPLARGLKHSMEQSYPALFAAGVLMLLVRRPLAGPWVAFLLLRRRLLLPGRVGLRTNYK
jgi:hypothetical protein